MNTASSGTTPQFHTRKLLICNHDLAGYARLANTRTDHEIAQLLHEYYGLIVAAVRAAGGRVLKYMGDSVLSVFEPDHAADAVAVFAAVHSEVDEWARRRNARLESGCNMHLSEVVEGDFGPEGESRHDVIGSGVNHAFLMGRGPGLRISEPVYRSLPNDARAAWNKVKPPAVYHFKG
jgi:class 3 adenylate cyclase